MEHGTQHPWNAKTRSKSELVKTDKNGECLLQGPLAEGSYSEVLEKEGK